MSAYTRDEGQMRRWASEVGVMDLLERGLRDAARERRGRRVQVVMGRVTRSSLDDPVVAEAPALESCRGGWNLGLG